MYLSQRIIALGLCLSLLANDIALANHLAQADPAYHPAIYASVINSCALTQRGLSGNLPGPFLQNLRAGLFRSFARRSQGSRSILGARQDNSREVQRRDTTDLPSQGPDQTQRELLERRYLQEKNDIHTIADQALGNLIPAAYQNHSLEEESFRTLLSKLRENLMQPTVTESSPAWGPSSLSHLRSQIDFLLGMHAAQVVLERESAHLPEAERDRMIRVAEVDLRTLWNSAHQRWLGGIFNSLPGEQSVLPAINELFHRWIDSAEQIIDEERQTALEQLEARHHLELAALELAEAAPLAEHERALQDSLERQTKSLGDGVLLQEIAPLLVENEPSLEEARAHLAEYVTARKQCANAIRQSNLKAIRSARRQMVYAIDNLLEALHGFSISNELQSKWTAELQEVSHALEFATMPSSPFHALAFEEIAHRLATSSFTNTDATIVGLVGFDIATLTDMQWPEFRDSLKVQHLFNALHASESLGPEARRRIFLEYLLKEVTAGHLSPITAERWWNHPPLLNSIEARDLISQMRKEPPVGEIAHARSSLGWSNGLSDWLSRHWVPATVVAILVAVLAGGVWFWHIPSGDLSAKHDLSPGLSSPTFAPAVENIFAGESLGQRLQRAQGITTNEAGQRVEGVQARAALARQLEQFNFQEKATNQRIQSRKIEAFQAKEAVEQADQRLKQARTAVQTRTETATNARAKASRKEFDDATRNLEPGQQTEPTSLASAKSRKVFGIPIPGIGGSGFSPAESEEIPSAAPPGARHIVMQFEKPITGFLRESTYEHFDTAHGRWLQSTPDLSNTVSVPRTGSGTPVNSVSGEILSNFTPLRLPAGYAPIPGSFAFSSNRAQFDIRQDAYGQYYLWVRNFPALGSLRVKFDITLRSADPWEHSAPTANSKASMESRAWEPDTQTALDQARQANSFHERMAILVGHAHNTFEYTLSAALDKHHRQSPGHYVSDVDRYKELLDGRYFRLGDCDTVNTYFAALARALGYESRLVTGFAAFAPSTQISNWVAHAISEVYDPGTRTWVAFDATPPDRVPNGEERRFAEELPTDQPQSQALREAQERYRSSLEEQHRTENALERETRSLKEIQQRRIETEERLRGLEKANAPARQNQVQLMEVLGQELARTADRVRKIAKENPLALIIELTNPNLALSFLRGEMDLAGVPHNIQVRYLAATVELAMESLSSEDARQIYPTYLQLLGEWLRDPTTEQPVVFDEIYDHQELVPEASAVVAASNIEPGPRAKHWRASGSFPIPVSAAQPGSKEEISSLLPAPLTGKDSPRWLQAKDGSLQGFGDGKQLYDLDGRSISLPTFQAHDIGPIVTGPKGENYALTTDAGGRDHITDILTGTELAWPQTLNGSIKKLAFNSGGEGFVWVADNTSMIKTTIYSLRTGKPIMAGLPYGSLGLFTNKGKIYAYDWTSGAYSVDVMDLNQGTTLRTAPLLSPQDPNRGVKGRGELTLLANPVTGKLYWAEELPDQVRFYDFDTSAQISPPGLFEASQPVFDNLGHGYYTARFIGRQGRVDFELGSQTPELPSTIGILVAVQNGVKYYMDESQNQSYVYVVDARGRHKFGPYNLPKDSAFHNIVVHGASSYLRVDNNGKTEIRSFERIAGAGSVTHEDVWVSEVVSNKNIDAVSDPVLVNDRVIFAERSNGRWRWNVIGEPFNETQAVHTTSEGVYFTSKINNRTYLFLGNGKSVTRVSPEGRSVGGIFDIGDEIYYEIDDSLGSGLWRAGQPNPIVTDVRVWRMERAPDGTLYYAGETGKAKEFGLWRVGSSKPLFTHDNFTGFPDIMFRRDGSVNLAWKTDDDKVTVYRQDGSPIVFPVTSQISPIRDSDGTVKYCWFLLQNDQWGLVQLSDGYVIPNAQFKNHPNTQFSPDGSIYFLGSDKLMRLNNPGFITTLDIPGDVVNFRIARDGTVHFWYRDSLYGYRLGWLSDARMSFGIHVPEFADFEINPRSRIGIIWDGIHRTLPHAYSGVGNPILLSENVAEYPTDGTVVGYRSAYPQAQTGPDRTAVMLVPGHDGQELLMLDPDQELDRLLAIASRMAWTEPSLLRSKEGQQTFETLLNRLTARWENSGSSSIPATELIRLYLLMASQADINPSALAVFERALSEISSLPQHQAEARTALAEAVQEVFRSYKEQFGVAPFNPEGVEGIDVVSHKMNNDLQTYATRHAPLRIGQPTAENLERLNERISELTRKIPWLQLSPQELHEIWMSKPELFVRWLIENMKQPTLWLLGIELIAALTGVYVEFKQRATRSHFAEMLTVWSKEMDEVVFGHREASAAFSLAGAVRHLPQNLQAPLLPYVKQYRHAPPGIQSAVWLILRSDGLIPPERTPAQRFWRPLTLWPVIREAREAKSFEKQWQDLVNRQLHGPEGAQPVIGDRTSLSHFLRILDGLKRQLRHELNLSEPYEQPVRQPQTRSA